LRVEHSENLRMKTIYIPGDLSPEIMIPFSLELKSHCDEPYVCLDFRSLGYVTPFGMLLLAALIRQFARSGREKFGRSYRLEAANFANKNYASWMGLFRSFGLRHGNEPGQAFRASALA